MASWMIDFGGCRDQVNVDYANFALTDRKIEKHKGNRELLVQTEIINEKQIRKILKVLVSAKKKPLDFLKNDFILRNNL